MRRWWHGGHRAGRRGAGRRAVGRRGLGRRGVGRRGARRGGPGGGRGGTWGWRRVDEVEARRAHRMIPRRASTGGKWRTQ
eukprot:scaffold14659_cov51-Phaeocystis_antarctica.AAC.2